METLNQNLLHIYNWWRKAKNGILVVLNSYSIDIALTNTLDQFKKANDITIDSYSIQQWKHTLMLQMVVSFATFTVCDL